MFRYSGNEFAVLLPFHDEKMPPLIDHMVQEFKSATEVENVLVHTDVTVVRVDYPAFGTKVGDLIAVMDYGIRRLKEQKKNSQRYLYDISVADTMRSYHAMINELRSAVQDHRFVVHYQPIYHMPTETFTQSEALI